MSLPNQEKFFAFPESLAVLNKNRKDLTAPAESFNNSSIYRNILAG